MKAARLGKLLGQHADDEKQTIDTNCLTFRWKTAITVLIFLVGGGWWWHAHEIASRTTADHQAREAAQPL
ncbi:MAG: hypothetical protein HQL63_14825 [Magnetococcales bacterium]|nr:hypothetical protein [Magnetococcales bacterium]MBF0322733.1 hypothetical protein [Magnetococcales bacterium]